LQSAVDTAPGAIKNEVSIVPKVVKQMIDSYAKLANEPAQ
jgi:hypothetical protein